MFQQFLKDKNRSSLENIAIKVIPLLFIIPIVFLFLFVGRMETISVLGVSLIVFCAVYFGLQAFFKIRKKIKETKK